MLNGMLLLSGKLKLLGLRPLGDNVASSFFFRGLLGLPRFLGLLRVFEPLGLLGLLVPRLLGGGFCSGCALLRSAPGCFGVQLGANSRLSRLIRGLVRGVYGIASLELDMDSTSGSAESMSRLRGLDLGEVCLDLGLFELLLLLDLGLRTRSGL